MKNGAEFAAKFRFDRDSGLLKAGSSTNFAYAVERLHNDDIEKLNAIDATLDTGDFVRSVYGLGGSLEFRQVVDPVFDDNLVLVDSWMPNIVANLLLVSFRYDIARMKSIVDVLEQENPMSYRCAGMYQRKVKKMLCAFAAGMSPSTPWDGSKRLSGSCVFTKATGEAETFRVADRDAMGCYLLESTFLERLSPAGNGSVSLCEEEGEIRLSLSLQIGLA